MKLYIVAVFDQAIEAFGRPFTVVHAGQAVRSFIDETKNPDSEIAKHPADFELWQLGHLDDASGDLIQDKQRLTRAADHTTTQGA